jgi:hypothetical protein
MRSLPELKRDYKAGRRKFWTLTTWATASILSGLILGIVGFNQVSTSALSGTGPAFLYLFLGTQAVLLGVVFYMYSLFESQKVEPSRVERAVEAYMRRLPAEDPRRLNMPRWKEVRWRHLNPIILTAQTLVILFLMGALSNEYRSNAFMQNWVQAQLPILSIILDPVVVAVLAGILLGSLLIHFLMRRSREERLLEYLQKLD